MVLYLLQDRAVDVPIMVIGAHLLLSYAVLHLVAAGVAANSSRWYVAEAVPGRQWVISAAAGGLSPLL
jgi:hypothetical protein